MQVDVLNIKGKKTGRTVELPEEVFGVEPNDHVIYLAVKQYLAAGRSGTHKVNFNASHLSSGVYFARLQAGTNVKAIKLTLLK